MRAIVGRLGGFTCGVILLGIASLASVPLVFSALGSEGWATYAVAQALGLTASVIVGFGWSITGPSTVALLSGAERARYVTLSLIVRGGLFVFTATALLLLTASHPSGLSWSHAPVALASCATGLFNTWFFVGARLPLAYVVREALPRAASTVGGPLLALIWPSQLTIGTVSGLGVLICLCAFLPYTRAQGRAARGTGARREIASTMRDNVPGFVTGAISAAYLSVPTVIVGAVSSVSVVNAFSLGDRVVKLALSAAAPLAQVAQGWVPRAEDNVAARLSRIRRAAVAVSGPAVVGGILIAALGRPAGTILSHGDVELDIAMTAAMGLTFAASLVSMCLGPGGLAVVGDARWIAFAALIGAVVVLSSLVPLVGVDGAAGALWSIAIAEVSVVTVQVFRLVARRRGQSTREDSA